MLDRPQLDARETQPVVVLVDAIETRPALVRHEHEQSLCAPRESRAGRAS